MPPRVMPVYFEAPLILGHKGVTAVLVPFDPRVQWKREPVALDDRREGWLIAGTLNGQAFEGWIGFRWRRHFVMIDPALRAAAKVAVGDTCEVTMTPTRSSSALAIAKEQAKLTTAPKKKAKPGPRPTAKSKTKPKPKPRR